MLHMHMMRITAVSSDADDDENHDDDNIKM